MSERDLLLDALVREVLGPRDGPFEHMSDQESPLDEYVSGVLAPRLLVREKTEGTAEVEISGEEDFGADDLGGDAGPGVGVADALGPSLDPRMRASSAGLSFALRHMAGVDPTFNAAVTFGVYEKTPHGSWKRMPKGEHWESVPCSNAVHDIASLPGVKLHIRARVDRNDPSIHRVSLYLVNDREIENDRGPSCHIYQPQIRVRCSERSELVPLERAARANNAEDQRLAVLYRERATMARGHLCSATWESVDPEAQRGAETGDDGALFDHWVDGEALWGTDNRSVVEMFCPAHARTEFVPVISVNAPDKSWPSRYGPVPEFNPEVLADLFNPSKLRSALQPLVDGLSNWIAEQRSVAASLDGPSHSIANRQLDDAQTALNRIADGIEVLCSDPDARRAFCFANKAIAMQSKWSKRSADAKPNSWFPFQLAFQLMAIRGITDPTHDDRKTCDLLWFPTGGGKTEAYLGLTAFVLALRRIRGLRSDRPFEGVGTAVISRYTLRLLTIQQFRRAVALLTACELLRNQRATPEQQGWRPSGDDELLGGNPWGTVRFSIGLWVGSQVTPAGLHDVQFKGQDGRLVTIPGALSILGGAQSASEPAQMTNCPCCGALLAVQGNGLAEGREHELHLVLCDAPDSLSTEDLKKFSDEVFTASSVSLSPLPNSGYATLSIRFTTSGTTPDFAGAIDRWWSRTLRSAVGGHCDVAAARASRPGYFVLWEARARGKGVDYEFEVYCPSPSCELGNGVLWSETLPAGPWRPAEPFLSTGGSAQRCPIPVWTVDSQVYHRLPSVLVATVDKFARLAFESRTSGMFGNVTHQHPTHGWFRSHCPPMTGALPKEVQSGIEQGVATVGPLSPPDLIIQDELHLIEGPLGSMVGLYETAIDELCSRIETDSVVRPKYVASTATVREAAPQVRSLFNRDLAVFPVSGTTIDDSFFARSQRLVARDDRTPGRLYVGVCAPGRGAQTPIVRIWSRLLQQAHERRKAGAADKELDGFWTLIGYFNAIRELAGARTLCEQDIPQRLSLLPDPRLIDVEELSSRTSSNELPGKLDALARSLPEDPQDVVLTTSMFGTGVDVSRLRLMFVAGQPKTTSSYIQATGRVGRQFGGLVVTFFRASRPRDLNHYEYFVGYHDAIYRHVEPITVNPFSERARDRALGPVAVALLRNAHALYQNGLAVTVAAEWRLHERIQGGWTSAAGNISSHANDPEVVAIPKIVEDRSRQQPPRRTPLPTTTLNHMQSELDRWKMVSDQHGDILYSESSSSRVPDHAVTLGDLAHEAQGLDVAFENAPNSLREVESTVTFRGRG